MELVIIRFNYLIFRFSPSCFLDNDNEVTCDACPPGYEGRRCERCAPNYAGNPLVVNDYCKPNTSRCDPIGSASPNPDPRTGRCRCKVCFLPIPPQYFK